MITQDSMGWIWGDIKRGRSGGLMGARFKQCQRKLVWMDCIR